MSTTVQRIQYFLTVADYLHFGRAAVRLGITQPALSQQIRRLEEQIGSPLLDRSSRSVSLTLTGAAVLEPLRRCVSAYEEAIASAGHIQRDHDERLRIGCPLQEIRSITPIFRKLAERFVNTRVEMKEMDCECQAKAIEQGIIDAGFLHVASTQPALDMQVIGRDGLAVALPANHPLARQRMVAIHQLKGETFINLRLDCGAYKKMLEDLFRKTSFEPQVEYESTGIYTALEMVAIRLGVAIAPGGIVGKSHQGVTIVPIQPVAGGMDLALAWRRGTLSLGLRQLQVLVREFRTWEDPVGSSADGAG